ncbi:MAG: hypothetical protein ACJ76N_32190 [Thermoanaerobaculia bacterium]
MIRRALSMMVLALALPGVVLAAQRPEPPNPVDDELVQMGRAIPGFGGLFYDAEGYPNVYLRDVKAAPALAALKSLGQGEVRVLQGRYDFASLVEWKRALRPAVLGQPGVVFLDADETRNRVVVGIDAAQAKSLDAGRLDKALALKGVPREAVVYQEVPAIRDLTGVMTADKAKKPATSTILDAARPVPGGVQIIFLNLPFAYFCTDGFNAYLDGAFGFVTNSHCTLNRGMVDGTPYAQGNDPFGSPIATETVDPGYFTGDPCPSGYKCRYSDSSFARYNTTSLGSLGKLAKTSSRGLSAGSITLKPPTSRFSISAIASALQGQVVNKIGVTSGWTYGPITATCADVGVTGSNYGLLCQNIVRAGSDHGDSGSPVFSWTNGSTVKLLGILWGGGTSNGIEVFAYSPLQNIQQELGSLRVK